MSPQFVVKPTLGKRGMEVWAFWLPNPLLALRACVAAFLASGCNDWKVLEEFAVSVEIMGWGGRF